MPSSKSKASKYDNPRQPGGIRTGTLDRPDGGGGPGDRGCEVAWVDTASGLRFTVAIGRGGDIVDATYHDVNLAYLTPNGLKPASHGAQRGDDWLHAWAGGLLTTCGPETIGRARIEDGKEIPLHGRHSNTPATLVNIVNPDPSSGLDAMSLSMMIQDAGESGPVFEIQRTIRCRSGLPEIHLHDEVENISGTTVAHNWLYHINLGSPLLEQDARLIYRGKAAALPFVDKPMSSAQLNGFKQVPGSNPEHAEGGEDNVFVDLPADGDGRVHVGLINPKRGLGLELVYTRDQLPRFNNWQRFCPPASYVTAIEPFFGSLLGKDNDQSPLARTQLKPGQSKRYDLTIRVLDGKAQTDALKRHDGELVPVAWL